MKHFLTILICLCGLTLFSQSKAELFAGPLSNHFYSWGTDSPHHQAKYQSGQGFLAGIGVDSIRLDWMSLRLTLQLEHYNGEVKVYDGGQGGGNLIEASVSKSLLALGVFPINFHLFRKMEINLGMNFSALMAESFDGTISGWRMNEEGYNEELHSRLSRFSCRAYLGLAGNVSYDFPLSESMVIAPQINYYFPLTSEFQRYIPETKSMRLAGCIGIKKRLGKGRSKI